MKKRCKQVTIKKDKKMNTIETFKELGFNYEFIVLPYGSIGHNFKKEMDDRGIMSIFFNIATDEIEVNMPLNNEYTEEVANAIIDMQIELGWINR